MKSSKNRGSVKAILSAFVVVAMVASSSLLALTASATEVTADNSVLISASTASAVVSPNSQSAVASTVIWEGWHAITTPSSSVNTPAFLSITNDTSSELTIYIKATTLPGTSWNVGVTDVTDGLDGWRTYVSLNQPVSFTAAVGHTYYVRASTYSTTGNAYIVAYV